jgi:hypothetical protein
MKPSNRVDLLVGTSPVRTSTSLVLAPRTANQDASAMLDSSETKTTSAFHQILAPQQWQLNFQNIENHLNL